MARSQRHLTLVPQTRTTVMAKLYLCMTLRIHLNIYVYIPLTLATLRRQYCSRNSLFPITRNTFRSIEHSPNRSIEKNEPIMPALLRFSWSKHEKARQKLAKAHQIPPTAKKALRRCCCFSFCYSLKLLAYASHSQPLTFLSFFFKYLIIMFINKTLDFPPPREDETPKLVRRLRDSN